MVERREPAVGDPITASGSYRRAELVADIGIALTSIAPLAEQLRGCAVALVRHLNAAFARIWTLEDDTDVLVLRASAGLYTHLDGGHGRVPVGTLKIGRIAAERRPHLTNLVAEDPHIVDKEWAAREGMVAFAGYPLIVGDRLLGVLAVFARETLADGTLDLLGAVADEVALGVARARADEERTRLIERERATHEEIETMYRLGTMAMAELDLEKLVQGVTDAATTLTGAQFGAFFYNITGESGESFTLYTISGVPREAFAGFPMPRNTAVFAPTFNAEGIVRLADVREDPRFGLNEPYRGMPPGHLPVVSYLAVPVVTRSGEALGGLFFGHEEAEVFTARHERIVAGLAIQAAVAMDNAHLYRQAQQALAVRDEFLAAVAHDLKTPLAAIKGTAQLLFRQAKRPGGIPPERLAAGLEGLDASSTRMARLVDHLLDVAHVDAGRTPELDRNPVDLVMLARRAAEEHRVTTTRHRIRVEANPAVVVGQWDAARLERVLDNLLSNAIKYSPEGGEVLIMVGLKGQDSQESAVLTVRDNGIGIPKADLPHVFERFRRGVNVGDHISGTGIGLASAAQIVRMHEGTIIAESTEQGGSTFIVRLPLAPPDQTAGLAVKE